MDAIPTRRFDPLSAVRTPAAEGFDLLLTGTVFQDIIFTGLPHAPVAGTEIWSDGMGSCPGGRGQPGHRRGTARAAHRAGGRVRR